MTRIRCCSNATLRSHCVPRAMALLDVSGDGLRAILQHLSPKNLCICKLVCRKLKTLASEVLHTNVCTVLYNLLYDSYPVSYVGHALGSAVSTLVPQAWPAEWPLQCRSFQTEITAASCLVCQYVPGQLLADFHTLFSCRPRFLRRLVCVTASGSAFIEWLARRVLVSYWPFSTAPWRPCMDRVAWHCAACSTARP